MTDTVKLGDEEYSVDSLTPEQKNLFVAAAKTQETIESLELQLGIQKAAHVHIVSTLKTQLEDS